MRPEFDIENYGRRNRNIYFSGADRKKKAEKGFAFMECSREHRTAIIDTHKNFERDSRWITSIAEKKSLSRDKSDDNCLGWLFGELMSKAGLEMRVDRVFGVAISTFNVECLARKRRFMVGSDAIVWL